jgi:serine/threonine-protein kinase
MATVFHAYDPRFERDVAIKVLPREFLHDPQFRTRFDREAKTIASLEHPAIVPVYDFGEEEGQPFIVMRYMSGGDLSDRIAKGPMPVTEATQILTRLAPALDAAHAKGIIHRDLKPGNILFDQYGNAFLSDFGIARLSAAGTTTLTGGAILGTPSYMSPEQIQGDREIDGRSDIYALGIILFQMLTGNTPYKADTPARVMMMHLLEPVPNILKTKADLPPTLESVVKQAMAKEPTQRFSTAAELATALETSTKPDAGALVHFAPQGL